MNGIAGKRTCVRIRILRSSCQLTPPVFHWARVTKKHEIWHSGYYPVAWTNTKYKMLYMNMGHNDIDYENKTNKELSLTFDNKIQSGFLLHALLTLGKPDKASAKSKK